MKIKIVYEDRQIETKTDLKDLEFIIKQDVVSVIIDDEMFYKLGDDFYYVPLNNKASKYLPLLNKYKER